MGQGNPVVRIVAEAHRWAVDFHRIPVVVALVAATAIWLLRSPHGVRRALVVVAAVALGFNTLFMSKASGSYPIYPLLALAIAAAGMSAEALTGAYGSRWRRITVGAWALLLANGATLVVGPRLIAATIQRDARDYDRVSAAVAAVVPAGATVWGDPRAWYAVVAAGAAMRTPTLWYNPQPDRERDRFVIQRFDAPPPEGYHAVAEIGSPLPIVWGTQVSDTDYRLRIYESRTAGDSPR
jgi:4-amino-4-deoxy-L-arabinose transferase-like glycosyltransferase